MSVGSLPGLVSRPRLTRVVAEVIGGGASRALRG